MPGFGFMNRFYYGKAGQADYTPEQLPSSRPQLFFEMLRIHFSGIIVINLLYLLFCLPGILWTVTNAMVLSGISEITADHQGMLILYLIGMVPCLMLAGVGATGEMYVLRNWARDQHAFMMSDFKDAIKGNWKQGLLTGFINGLSLLVAAVCFVFYGQLASQSVLWLVPQMLVAVVAAVWWMGNMLIFTMMVTYDMKYRDLARNAAIIAIARLPWSVLFLVASIAIPAALVLFVPYGEIISLLLYVVIGFALTGLVYASYANACFDKYLNPRIEGAAVNMGLRETSPDDDEDEDDTLV